MQKNDTRGSKGKLFIVGMGPGGKEHITPLALSSLNESDVIVGYDTYIELLGNITEGKEVIRTGMTKELERCEKAIELALSGRTVSVVSSGDPGIYGMAGLIFELLDRDNTTGLDVRVVPGVPALAAASSVLGAPLMHDFSSISLSDILTPWNVIKKRLHGAASSDMVIVLYNPRSTKRTTQLPEAMEIIREYQEDRVPVGIVKNATRDNEEAVVTSLAGASDHYEQVDMSSIVIIGNSSSFTFENRIVTPRGYDIRR